MPDGLSCTRLFSGCRAWSILGSSTKQRIIELFCSATQELLAAVSSSTQQQGLVYADPRDATRAAGKLRSAFKALTYMFAVTVQVAEKTYAPKAEALGGAGGKGKKVRRASLFSYSLRPTPSAGLHFGASQ